MPTGSEFNLWLSFMNRAVQEWSESHDWETLKKYYWPGVTGASQASIPMPLDYRKLAAPIRVQNAGDSEGGTPYPDILENQKGMYLETDEYVYEVGNYSDGYHIVFHPGTLASGASIEIQYYSMPTSLASPAEIPLVEDSQFLIDRTIAYIFEARSDPRFQSMETKARDRLMLMIENSSLSKYNSYDNPAPVINTLRKQGFRVGRD